MIPIRETKIISGYLKKYIFKCCICLCYPWRSVVNHITQTQFSMKAFDLKFLNRKISHWISYRKFQSDAVISKYFTLKLEATMTFFQSCNFLILKLAITFKKQCRLQNDFLDERKSYLYFPHCRFLLLNNNAHTIHMFLSKKASLNL